MKMKISTFLKWVTGGCEAFLAIPFFGGAFVLSLLWTPLMVMFVLHLLTLIFCIKEGDGKNGSILGMVTSVLGFIPVLGMVLHMASALLLLLDAGKSLKNTSK